MDIKKKLSKEEIKKLSKFKITKKRLSKNFKFCKICWRTSDGHWVLLSEMNKYAEDSVFINKYWEVCDNCKDWLKEWVNLICLWINPISNKVCNSVFSFDEEIIQKYFPDIKKGDGINVFWCVKCQKKFKFIP